jgi:hypothetical protein
MPFARASSLDRLMKCYGGSILGGEDVKSESTKIAADWGTMTHGWKETGKIEVVNGRKNLVPLLEKKIKLTGVRREDWWPGGMVHELAMAVKPFESYAQYEGPREEKEAWKAGLNDDWCTGTVDGFWWMFDVLCVEDLKTGRAVTWEEYEEQQRFYCLGLSRLLDYRGPVHAVLNWWPRYPVLSLPQRFGRVIEQDELNNFEKRLVGLRDNIRRAREDKTRLRLTPGEAQCLWCPSRRKCPEAVNEERGFWNG